VVAVTERVDRADIGAWCGQTFTALYAGLIEAGSAPAGPGGALYSDEFFTVAVGEVTAYVPVEGSSSKGPAHTMIIPGGPHAVAMHAGPLVDFDKTYAALGSHVAAYETAAPGPIREIYLVSPPDTTDEASLRTQVCWPLAG
jgi:effector-binding domain-containing protein